MHQLATPITITPILDIPHMPNKKLKVILHKFQTGHTHLIKIHLTKWDVLALCLLCHFPSQTHISSLNVQYHYPYIKIVPSHSSNMPSSSVIYPLYSSIFRKKQFLSHKKTSRNNDQINIQDTNITVFLK